jgi:cytochrome c553
MIKRRFPGCQLLPVLVGMAMLPARAEAENVSAPPVAGRCVACHGADGIGKAPQYPDLRGQKTAYMEKQMRAFRSGEGLGHPPKGPMK